MDFFFYFVDILWTILRESFQFTIQIGLLTVIIYTALLFLKGTRAEPVLVGITITFLSGWLISQSLNLQVFEWLLERSSSLLVFAIFIIFQPEIRRAFAEIGTNPRRFIKASKRDSDIIEALLEASFVLAREKIGGLITIEGDIGLRTYYTTGVRIDAPVSSPLIITIFYPNTPLHDGAIMIRDGIITAAGCLFPLTETPLNKILGTRHRAGIGITEVSDAFTIIISEERGEVSLARRGRLVKNVSRIRLRRHLRNFLVKKKDPEEKKILFQGFKQTFIKAIERENKK